MKRCIVIADDDPVIIDLVKLRLGLAQYHVLTTGDGVAAVALARKHEPVAIILDVKMPGGTAFLSGGLRALETIKSDPELKNLPVMMLTGERNTETVMSAMTGGANDYMVKPFNPDTLLERVSRMVKSSAMQWRAPTPAEVWEL
jgi:DNA-binding response OmpR family regulator